MSDDDASPPAILPRQARLCAGLLVGFAAAVLLHGILFRAGTLWPNLLMAAFYLLSLGVSGLFFFAGQRLASARWSAGLRRLPEALMLLIPWGALAMLALYFGRHTLYWWTRHDAFAGDPPIAGRARYLTEAGVFGRAAVTFAIWTASAWRLRALSLAQDRHPLDNLAKHEAMNRVAALFTMLIAPTFTFVVHDWILSLERHWFSTVFGVYVFAGTFVQGIAAVTVGVLLLRGRGLLPGVAGPDQLRDLGRMLFAFSMVWAYVWFCQYLIIWYGNLPDEVPYYIQRTRGAWRTLFAVNFVLNGAAPFLALLSARARRDPGRLLAVSVLLLIGRWLDLYIMIMPAQLVAARPGIDAFAMAAGVSALAFLLVAASLARAPLIPENDPMLVPILVPTLVPMPVPVLVDRSRLRTIRRSGGHR